MFEVTSDGVYDGSNEGKEDGKLIGMQEDDIDGEEDGI